MLSGWSMGARQHPAGNAPSASWTKPSSFIGTPLKPTGRMPMASTTMSNASETISSSSVA